MAPGTAQPVPEAMSLCHTMALMQHPVRRKRFLTPFLHNAEASSLLEGLWLSRTN